MARQRDGAYVVSTHAAIRSLLFDPRDVSVMTCMLQAQPIIAQWKESHHKWDVRRWQCGMRSMNVSSI